MITTEMGLTIVLPALIECFTLTGPDHWTYEGQIPHVYVVRIKDQYFGFWNDKDDGGLINSFCVHGDFESEARWKASSLEDLKEEIEKDLTR